MPVINAPKKKPNPSKILPESILIIPKMKREIIIKASIKKIGLYIMLISVKVYGLIVSIYKISFLTLADPGNYKLVLSRPVGWKLGAELEAIHEVQWTKILSFYNFFSRPLVAV